MKLYNIFEELILEEIMKNSKILSEGVSPNAVKAAIRDKVNVKIEYQDYENEPPSKRYIQVYNYASTKANNDSIRAYQISGGSKSKNPNNWKIFLLDKIVSWYPTKMKWQNPVSDYDITIPAYNQLGDKSMSQVYDKVNPDTFTRQRSDIYQNPNITQDNEENEEF